MFFNRKKREKDENIGSGNPVLDRENAKRQFSEQVVSLSKEILEMSKSLDAQKAEYRLVNSYLEDIEKIEELEETTKKKLTDAAASVLRLTHAQSQYINSEKRITDSQFAQMKEEEHDMPDIIRRLEDNERYLASIEKDMHILEGEKIEWSIAREDCVREMKLLRRIAVLLFIGFGIAESVIFILSKVERMDLQLVAIIVAFVVTVLGVYVLLRYQHCIYDTERCDVNRNYTITLENKRKFRYVNIKNAVDYSCTKYQITNSKQLTYIYEQYLLTVQELQKMQQMGEDLEYYSDKLNDILGDIQVSDVNLWFNYANALAEAKEMVEIKHNLLERRQKLRKQLQYNMGMINDTKETVLKNIDKVGKHRAEVEAILRKVEKNNRL